MSVTTEEFIVEINQLIKRISTHQFNSLMEKRERNGHHVFIPDLKEQEDAQGQGWSFTQGTLHIDYPFDDGVCKNAQALIDRYMKQAGKTWFKSVRKATDEYQFNSRAEKYKLPIKTLGIFGVNHAVDPVLLIKAPNGRLKILSIVRKFDNPPSRALPGGMVEGSVEASCIHELLEEVFGGSLFKEGAENSRVLQQLYFSDPAQEFTQKLASVLQTNLETLAKKYPVLDIQSILRQLLEEGDHAMTPDAKIREILLKLSGMDFNVDNFEPKCLSRTQFVMHIKTELYKQLLPQQYQQFERAIHERVIKGQPCFNGSDPRNTSIAYMVTTPLTIVCDDTLFNQEFMHLTGLEVHADDDAEDAKFLPLEVFFFGTDVSRNRLEPYSDHGAILLRGMRNALARGHLEPTDEIYSQFKELELGVEKICILRERSIKLQARIAAFETGLNDFIHQTTDEDKLRLLYAFEDNLNSFKESENVTQFKDDVEHTLGNNPLIQSSDWYSQLIEWVRAFIRTVTFGYSQGFFDQTPAAKKASEFNQVWDQLADYSASFVQA